MHTTFPIADDDFDAVKALLELEGLATDAATTVASALAQATDAYAKDAAAKAAQEAAATAALDDNPDARTRQIALAFRAATV